MLYFIEVFAVLLLLGGLFLLSRFNRRRRLRRIAENAKNDYLKFLSTMLLGAGTLETSREYCKIKQVWDLAEDHFDMFAALQFTDGISVMALDDAAERLDTECLAEVERSFRHRRNHLLWSLIRLAEQTGLGQKDKIDQALPLERIAESKRGMGIRFCHLIKSYPRTWEHN